MFLNFEVATMQKLADDNALPVNWNIVMELQIGICMKDRTNIEYNLKGCLRLKGRILVKPWKLHWSSQKLKDWNVITEI